MKPAKRTHLPPGIEPWPPGWPLPLFAMSPSLRWEDAVEFYLAYLEATGTTANQAGDSGHSYQPPGRRAA